MTTPPPDPFAMAADILDPPTNPYLASPTGWVRDKLGEHLWSRQATIMESVRDNRRTAVPACHGPGKSWSAGRLVSWWLDTHPAGTAFAVTTAPTDKQVKAILWREIGRAHRKGDLPGDVLQNAEWKIGGELVAYGRKPADHDEHAFQGIHARYVLVILDEACGIPLQLWTASSTLLTNEDARILAVGNPDDPTAEFARVCDGADPARGGMSRLGWNVLPISAFATPNFTGERVPDEIRKALTSRMWAEEFARDVGGPMLVDAHRELLGRIDAGEDLADAFGNLSEEEQETVTSAPLYVSKVIGQFPTDATDGVIPWSWLRACSADNPLDPGDPRCLGVDVGGSESGDETVVYERVGATVGRRWSIRSADPEKVLQLVEGAIDESEALLVKIDSIGIGWGIMGGLRRSRPHVHVVGVNVAEASNQPSKFKNVRSQLWWEVGRNLSKDLGWDLSGVPESTLAELAAPRWQEDTSGRIVVESKDDLRKRLGRSTDNADALLLAFFSPGVPTVHSPASAGSSVRGAGRWGRRVQTGAPRQGGGKTRG